MTYRAPVGEMRFLLDRVLGAERLAQTERFAEATPETVEAILTEAGRLAEDMLAPTRRAGDLEPALVRNLYRGEAPDAAALDHVAAKLTAFDRALADLSTDTVLAGTLP